MTIEEIGREIALIRHETGITVREIAEAMGKSRQAVETFLHPDNYRKNQAAIRAVVKRLARGRK